MKFDPKDFSKEELQRLASLGLQRDIERALKRLPVEFVENFSGTEEECRWVENYIKLNPGGICSIDSVKVSKYEGS